MASMSSYNNDRSSIITGEVEYPVDPASGSFFQADLKKNEDLKQMLDSSKDSAKLEAMKRIIGMIAKGRDASDLFPSVVKNVVSKNIEVKKLVYVYLVRYAEEQQDLALLSISTFQRALKDPNQLIRASALRVLSSVRVGMIAPIVMLAIRESSSDMSPYVRKTAAHAIPKLYSLDPEQKEELISIIDKLLSDKAPLVVGSAAMAFVEVCPDHMSLIHKCYRKLCALLVDVDEWGQLVLLSVLTRYAREHFPDPNGENVLSASDSEDDNSDTDTSNSKAKKNKNKTNSSPSLNADHRLLLRAAKPLLQSRNSGVVMQVAQLFYHAGPVCDLSAAAKAMIRLLRGPVEVQSVVLHSIATLTIKNSQMFEPYLKSFFVRTSDPTHIKLLKLEIMTNLATETNVPVILREFQTYINSNDKKFAGETIQSIGRLALNIEHFSDTFLNGLLQLLSSKDEVVGAVVVVVKRVMKSERAMGAVRRCTKLLLSGRLNGALPRAAATWLVAQHGANTHYAPTALAHLLKNFTDEEEVVKLQILTLAVKLSITQPNTLPLCQYLLTLARYDNSYDVRDRARLLKRFIEPDSKESNILYKHAERIFLTDKPMVVIESKFKDRQDYTLGSLSHYIGSKAYGYTPLPTFPDQVLAASDRETDTIMQTTFNTTPDKDKIKHNETSFYSEDGSNDSSSEPSSSDSNSSDENEKDSVANVIEPTSLNNNNISNESASSSGSSDSESDSSESWSGSDQSSNASSSSEKKKSIDNKVKPEHTTTRKPPTNLDLLLELDEVANTLPTLTPSFEGFLTPISNTAPNDDVILQSSAQYTPTIRTELLSRINGSGLSVHCRFTRAPHLYSNKMAAIEMQFHNHNSEPVNNIKITKKILSGSQTMHEFAHIPVLQPDAVITSTMGVDFVDTIQPIKFCIHSSLDEKELSISPPIGELVCPISITEQRWAAEQSKLKGLTECEKKLSLTCDSARACENILKATNLYTVRSSSDELKFAAQTLSAKEIIFVWVKISHQDTRVFVNCANMTIASLMLQHITKNIF